MKKTMLIVINVITGLFVAFSSIVGYLFSGIGEESTNNVGLLVWLLVWSVGVVLQFKLNNKVIGLIITFIPVVYFIFVYIAAVTM